MLQSGAASVSSPETSDGRSSVVALDEPSHLDGHVGRVLAEVVTAIVCRAVGRDENDGFRFPLPDARDEPGAAASVLSVGVSDACQQGSLFHLNSAEYGQ